MNADTGVALGNSRTATSIQNNRSVSVRRIPYPYRAMLAICSDLDETPDKHTYFETMRFLNTTETTTMGQGLGLETGNTIYFDMPSDQFSYWNTDEKGREMIRTLIQSGHIDCLHSFGDLATTRAHAERILEELSRHNCKLNVWIDHGTAPSNFGRDIMQGQGAVKGSMAYHADLTTDFGIQYVWLGRITSIIGQNVPRRLSGIWNLKHPATSAKTLFKEFSKGLCAHGGSPKYAMHGPNQVLRKVQLRSGHSVYEFMRSTPHWGGISYDDSADGLAEVFVDTTLSRLVAREGVCIIYTHLGKCNKNGKPFGTSTPKALELLAQYSQEKRILVTTTHRILRYCHSIQDLMLAVSTNGDGLRINIETKESEKTLEGLSIYVPVPDKTDVTINGHDVINFQRNAPDHTGRLSVSVPWSPLDFPAI